MVSLGRCQTDSRNAWRRIASSKGWTAATAFEQLLELEVWAERLLTAPTLAEVLMATAAAG